MLKSIGEIWSAYWRSYWMRLPILNIFFINGQLRWVTWFWVILFLVLIIFSMKIFPIFGILSFMAMFVLGLAGFQEWYRKRKFFQEYQKHGINFYPSQDHLQILHYVLWLKIVRESSEISSVDLDRCRDWFTKNSEIGNVESSLKHPIMVPFIAFLFLFFLESVKGTNFWAHGIEEKMMLFWLVILFFVIIGGTLDFLNSSRRNIFNLRNFLEWEAVDRSTIENNNTVE